MPTNPDERRTSLSAQQEAAVDQLAVGHTVTEVAKGVGVARQTVSEWVNRSPAFRAALNGRRQELWREASDRLRNMLPKALGVIDDQLIDADAGQRLKAASIVLRATGLYGLSEPQGLTEPEDIESCDRENEARKKTQRLFAGLV
jgi:transposase